MTTDQQFDSIHVQPLIEFLAVAASELSAVKSLVQLSTTLGQIVNRLFKPEYFSIYLVDPDTGELTAPFVEGFTEEERLESIRTAKDRHPGRVVRTGETINIPDVEADTTKSTQDSRRSFKVASRLWMPVTTGRGIAGTIGFASVRKYAFTELHVSVMKFAAQLAAITYENIVNERRMLQKIELIEQQREELRRLASPMIEVWHGVLALPLIGMMDAQRFSMVAEKVLPAIVDKRAKTVIVDLTGIEEMDGDAIVQLARLRSAIELLGCQCVISGIRYETAKQMIGSGGDFNVGSTVRTLAQALGMVSRKGSATLAGRG